VGVLQLFEEGGAQGQVAGICLKSGLQIPVHWGKGGGSTSSTSTWGVSTSCLNTLRVQGLGSQGFYVNVKPLRLQSQGVSCM
jgi:hypothetical protein